MLDGQGPTDCIAFHPTNANTMYERLPSDNIQYLETTVVIFTVSALYNT